MACVVERYGYQHQRVKDCSVRSGDTKVLSYNAYKEPLNGGQCCQMQVMIESERFLVSWAEEQVPTERLILKL